MTTGRKPDYKVSVALDGKYYDIGGAWVNESGTVSITLDPFVSIPPQPQTKLMMIPKDFQR